jgi:hypothetical protein
VHLADAGALGNGAHPAVCRPPIQAAAVVAEQDRTGRAFADGQVDCPRRPGYERDHGRLVALADDAKGSVAPLETEVLDVGRARLADPQAVEAQEHGESGVGVVDPLGFEQEPSELGAVEAAGVVGVDLGSADVLGRVGGDTAVDVGEAVEAADRGQPPVDGRRRQTTALHGPHVELDLGPSGLEDVEALIGRPLEERPQVVAVGVEGASQVAGKERRRRQFGLVDGVVPSVARSISGMGINSVIWNLPASVRSPANLAAEACATSAGCDL